MKVLLALAALAALYQVAVVLAVKVGWRNARVPHRRDPSQLGLGFQTVRVPTAGGKTLHAWWIPSNDGGPCLVLAHGWGRNVERMLPWIDLLHPAGFALLTIDARHHGSSDEDGYASMVKFSEDIRSAVDWAERERGARAVGVLGLSVGGAAAIHAASREPRIAAVATVGAFADPADPRATIGRRWWLLAPGLPLAFRLVERRMGLRFRDVAPERVIGRARARFLVIHGADDVVIPVANARKLAAAGGAAVQTWIIPGRGHSDPHREPDMAARLTSFYRSAL